VLKIFFWLISAVHRKIITGATNFPPKLPLRRVFLLQTKMPFDEEDFWRAKPVEKEQQKFISLKNDLI